MCISPYIEANKQVKLGFKSSCVPCHVFGGQSDCILSHYGLPSTRVCSDKNTVSHLQMINRLFLESVQFERILEHE